MLALSMHSCIGNTGAAILFPSTSDILLVLRYRCILHQVLSKYCQVSKSTSSLMSVGNRIAQPSAEKAIRLTFTTHDFGTKADLVPFLQRMLVKQDVLAVDVCAVGRLLVLDEDYRRFLYGDSVSMLRREDRQVGTHSFGRLECEDCVVS